MLYIFDLDGTLTNTLATIAFFANEALKKYGIAPHPIEDYRKFVGNGRDILIHRILKARNCDTAELFQKVGSVYDNGYENNFMYLTTVYDGILEVLNKLKERGDFIAVCSNKPDNVVQFVVNEIFGTDFFDAVRGQVSGIPVKPSPASVHCILKQLEKSKEDCFFIGDTNVDIETGKNAGITTIGVLWGFRDLAELTNAGADFIAKEPIQILDHKK